MITVGWLVKYVGCHVFRGVLSSSLVLPAEALVLLRCMCPMERLRVHHRDDGGDRVARALRLGYHVTPRGHRTAASRGGRQALPAGQVRSAALALLPVPTERARTGLPGTVRTLIRQRRHPWDSPAGQAQCLVGGWQPLASPVLRKEGRKEKKKEGKKKKSFSGAERVLPCPSHTGRAAAGTQTCRAAAAPRRRHIRSAGATAWTSSMGLGSRTRSSASGSRLLPCWLQRRNAAFTWVARAARWFLYSHVCRWFWDCK